jgi:hypothetical protein
MGVAGRDYMRDRPLDLGGGEYGGDDRPRESGGRSSDFPWRKGRWWALACATASAALCAFGVFVRLPEQRALVGAAASSKDPARLLHRTSEELHSLGFVAVALALGALVVGGLCMRSSGSAVGRLAVVLGLVGGAGGAWLLGAS